MWPVTFEQRLQSWHDLRSRAERQTLPAALTQINQWWYSTPWRPYYLHWDDLPTWPDPWQLLSDNIYCEVARGLGILYTCSFIQHPELMSAELVLTADGHNLVQVNAGKYILNWNPDTIVNNNLEVKITRHLTQGQVQQQYN